MSPPPFPKIFFFKKCVCVSRHFYITQKGLILLSMRYFVIEYLLFEWLKVQTNWFGWLKPWKQVICARSAKFFLGIFPVPPPFPSLLSKFHVPPPNTDDIFLHPPIAGQNFMSPPHSWTKCVVPPIFVQSCLLPPPQIKGTPPRGVFGTFPKAKMDILAT